MLTRQKSTGPGADPRNEVKICALLARNPAQSMLVRERERWRCTTSGSSAFKATEQGDQPVRRAVPAGIITLIGLGALASFKSSPGVHKLSSAHGGKGGRAVAAAPPPGTATSAPLSRGLGPVTGTTPSTSAGAVRTIDGDPVDNPYGTVQVRVTLHGTKITNVAPLQMPVDRQYSAEISQQAAPLLLQEVLQAQSAQIGLLSGASFTSQSYAQSLQSALDKARH
jgi:uncharacterized protein with FMN-binding domain